MLRGVQEHPVLGDRVAELFGVERTADGWPSQDDFYGLSWVRMCEQLGENYEDVTQADPDSGRTRLFVGFDTMIGRFALTVRLIENDTVVEVIDLVVGR